MFTSTVCRCDSMTFSTEKYKFSLQLQQLTKGYPQQLINPIAIINGFLRREIASFGLMQASEINL